ncbi:MAG: sigma-70 family RNA polymerase sigma factor, partial [Methanobacteriota archaeon]
MSTNPAYIGNQGAAEPEEVREWVVRAQAGDEAAFEQLYRLYVRRIYSLSRRMLAESDWAEEVTQDIFIRAWKALGGFRSESSFFSWRYRLAVNRVLGSMREKRRRIARVFPAEDRLLERRPDKRASTE